MRQNLLTRLSFKLYFVVVVALKIVTTEPTLDALICVYFNDIVRYCCRYCCWSSDSGTETGSSNGRVVLSIDLLIPARKTPRIAAYPAYLFIPIRAARLYSFVSVCTYVRSSTIYIPTK